MHRFTCTFACTVTNINTQVHTDSHSCLRCTLKHRLILMYRFTQIITHLHSRRCSSSSISITTQRHTTQQNFPWLAHTHAHIHMHRPRISHSSRPCRHNVCSPQNSSRTSCPVHTHSGRYLVMVLVGLTVCRAVSGRYRERTTQPSKHLVA